MTVTILPVTHPDPNLHCTFGPFYCEDKVVAVFGAADGAWWGAASCANEAHAARAVATTLEDMEADHSWGHTGRSLIDAAAGNWQGVSCPG